MSSSPADPSKPAAIIASAPRRFWLRRRAIAGVAAASGCFDASGGKTPPFSRDGARTSHPCMHTALAASLLLPLSGAAQAPGPYQGGSSTSFAVTLTIRPVFRILDARPVPGGHEYRIWTNLKSARLNGRDYRFEHVGETTLVVPGELIESPVKPAL